MVKGAIKNGFIVKVTDGRVDMVVWKRSNDDIGINFGHYWIIINNYKDRTPTEQKEMIMAMGVDEVFDKGEIIEVVRNNDIYKQR